MKTTGFVGYEYQDVTVKQNVAAMYANNYENFGWTLEGTAHPLERVDSVTLRFKRDRRIENRGELTRLQRRFNDYVAEVSRLETAKTGTAMAVAMGVGIVGSALMAGAVFAFVSGVVLLGVLLAIAGAAGWALPYLLYHRLSRGKTERVAPLLEERYDELYEVCEKASGLLAG